MGDSWAVENLLSDTTENAWASVPRAEAHSAWVILDLGENPNTYWGVTTAPSTLYPGAFANAIQISSSPNAVTWSARASSFGLPGEAPVELRFSATQDRYIKVDFVLETSQPGDRYYVVVDSIKAAGAPASDRALELYFSGGMTQALVERPPTPSTTHLVPFISTETTP